MTTLSPHQLARHSHAEARALIAEALPAHHLDFVGAYAGCLCWHIFKAGSLELAGSLYELPDGTYAVAWKPWS
jgi:hypothetical protein